MTALGLVGSGSTVARLAGFPASERIDVKIRLTHRIDVEIRLTHR
jgi:hypothetical protein